MKYSREEEKGSRGYGRGEVSKHKTAIVEKTGGIVKHTPLPGTVGTTPRKLKASLERPSLALLIHGEPLITVCPPKVPFLPFSEPEQCRALCLAQGFTGYG